MFPTVQLTARAMFFIFSILPLVQSVTVSTNYGQLQGLTAPYPNTAGPFKSVSKFLGVPFAALHSRQKIGNQAFAKRKRMETFVCKEKSGLDDVIRSFTQDFTYNEDCLYLDVYTPNISSSLPVMVYIHGGGYELGNSIMWFGDILALQVVVVVRYRLGPFGFLTTGDSAAPGNFGMLDQVEALKWVKANIENLGGNPGKVTIFGESAGASSVSLHLLSPLYKDLFQKAIVESGVDLSSWATQPVSFGLGFAKELAEKLTCPTANHGNARRKPMTYSKPLNRQLFDLSIIFSGLLL